MMARHFLIKTFGCQMNKNDSAIIARLLEDHNYKPSTKISQADIIIVNTCSVREHAEIRAMGYIATLKKWRCNGDRILAVVGCMAKRIAHHIISSLPHVDLVLGPDDYKKLPALINRLFREKTRIIDTTVSEETYCGIYQRNSQICDYVSIMRGCDNYCSYCIVPYVRGRSRARPVDDIINEVQYLIHQGTKDITLLGQNVNAYYYHGTNFAKLLDHIARVPGLFRLRFLSSHPKDFHQDILKVVMKYHNICEWFHLPLQSACNRLLELMNRQYSKEQFFDIVKMIRDHIPEAVITTDVIVGFPTEQEEEFLETLEFMERIRFDDAYMYRYSIRPGTKAAEMAPLPEAIIKRRLKKLIDFQSKIIIEKALQMVGKRYEVLFEKELGDKATRGKTRGNKDVIVEARIKPGTLAKVTITKVKGRTPIGQL